MKRHMGIRGAALAAMVVMVWADAARGADEPAGEVKAPASIAGLPEDARALLERGRQTLARAGTLKATMEAKFVMRREGESEEDAQTHERKETWLIAAPDRLRYEVEDFVAMCDGTTVTASRPDMKQYVQRPFGGTEKVENQMKKMGAGFNRVPFIAVLRPEASLAEHVGKDRIYTGARADTVGGEAGMWLIGTVRDQRLPDDSKVTFEVFLAASDGLPRRGVNDYTAYYVEQESMMAGMRDEEEEDEAPAKVVSARWENVYTIELGKEIDPGRFAFAAPEGHKKVEEFRYASVGQNAQDALLGLAAPEFEGKELFENGKIALADLRGKVVVLDFWATWCGPCVAALPHVQAVADRLADEPVVFLGMNRDQPGSTKRIQKFLDKKKVTIRQFDDREGDVAEKYKVRGIPCMVLIDKAGLVQAVHVGFSEDGEEELESQVRTLLKGEALKTDAEFRAARDEAAREESEADDEDGRVVMSFNDDEDGEDGEASSSTTARAGAAIEEFEAQRLERVGTLTSQVSMSGSHGMSGRPIDLGDGRERVLLSTGLSGRAGLSAIAPDGNSVEKIALEGMPRNAHVVWAGSIRVDGRPHLLVGLSSHMATPAFSLRMYGSDGKQVWSHEIGDKKVSVHPQIAIGDLDMDGRDEIVMSFMVMPMARSGSVMARAQKMYLSVLSADGTLVARKKLKGLFAGSPLIAQEPSEGKGRLMLVHDGMSLTKYRLAPSTAPSASPEASAGR